MQVMKILKHLAENEEKVLKPYAVLSSESKGRRHAEARSNKRSESRLCFQKDRDRVIHSRAFRRLEDKTQVFVEHHGKHCRNRLTHTLEVAQIARDLARMLGLNEDLAEAIALAHDLGHTPFGHAGEEALDEVLQEFEGEDGEMLRFEHNEQSRRVVEELEVVYPDFEGLNLSIEVLEGLMKHQTSWDEPGGDEDGEMRSSLEAQIVNLADEIAYQNHDIDDGLRVGLFTEEDLKRLGVWRAASEAVYQRYGGLYDDKIRVARTVSKMIGLMIRDVYAETLKRLDSFAVETLEDVYKCDGQIVRFSPKMAQMNLELKDFLAKKLYFSEEVLKHSKKGQWIIKALFVHYEKELGAEEARDFIAGMTDRFAQQRAEELQLGF